MDGDAIAKLLDIMAQLRDPNTGCPWDCEQTFSSIVPHTIEETYEVVDCVEREDYAHLKEELGDLLFQVVFLSRIAEEQGMFNFYDVAAEISEKLERRHPHVFGDAKISSQEELKTVWESIKQSEREQKQTKQSASVSVLDDVESTHPGLTHSYKLQKKAAKVGFDWDSVQGVYDKLDEELGELKAALREEVLNDDHVVHEMGDVLFACVNLARHVKVNPETAIRKANYRFEKRFRYMESMISNNESEIQSLTLEEMERYWQQAKHELEN